MARERTVYHIRANKQVRAHRARQWAEYPFKEKTVNNDHLMTVLLALKRNGLSVHQAVSIVQEIQAAGITFHTKRSLVQPILIASNEE